MRQARREVTSLKSFVTCPGGATETPCSKWTTTPRAFHHKTHVRRSPQHLIGLWQTRRLWQNCKRNPGFAD